MGGRMISESRLAEPFWRDGKCAECPVIDMHGHMGPWRGIWFPRPSPEAMVHTMDQAGVRLLCFAHHAALFSPDVGNAAAVEAVRRFPDRLRAYIAVNPHYPDAIARDLQAYDAHRDVFVGIKVLAAYHMMPWNHPAYGPAWRFADERGLLALAHTWGGSTFDGQDMVREVAPKYPNLKLLLGHSLHGSWDDAIALAKEFPHLYLELTAVLDDRGPIEKFVAAGLADRMLFGTDLPWFDPHHGIGALLSADITDEDRHKILHANAEALLATVGVRIEGPGRAHDES